MFTSHQSWNMTGQNEMGSGVIDQAAELHFTTGPTGMTPISDPMWPTEGIGDGNEWMMGWLGSTPQPQ